MASDREEGGRVGEKWAHSCKVNLVSCRKKRLKSGQTLS